MYRIIACVFAALSLLVSPAGAQHCERGPVYMVSALDCGVCRRAKDFFAMRGIRVVVVREYASLSHAPGPVPAFEIGAYERVGFYEDEVRRALCLQR